MVSVMGKQSISVSAVNIRSVFVSMVCTTFTIATIAPFRALLIV